MLPYCPDWWRELANLCHIEKGTRVLDVASGTGESAYYLAAMLDCYVVGVDYSPTLLGRARKKTNDRQLGVEFKQGDDHNLPFADNSFDIVISECALCLLDKERAIREMVRVTRPGGYVGIHDICWKESIPDDVKHKLGELEGERPETLKGWKELFKIFASSLHPSTSPLARCSLS